MTSSSPRHTNDHLAVALLLDATATTAHDEATRARADRAEQDEMRRQAETEQRRRQEADRDGRRQRAAVRMREHDGSVFGAALLLCVTVLAPYLLGHFVMRETALLTPDPAVYDGAVRGLADHFVPDYLAGVVTIAGSTALFLLVRPWYYRARWVVTGWVLVLAVVVFLMPTTQERWEDSEQTSVGKLASTAFPFESRYYTCDSYRYSVNWRGGGDEVWQIYLTQEAGFGGFGCNRVSVYNGWRQVGTFTMTDGDTFRPDTWDNTDITAGGFYLHTIWVVVRTGYGATLRFSLEDARNNRFDLSY